jgi:photosystem II stability/assembly factor-like uncharacterized protein
MRGSPTGSLEELLFANALDGYALEGDATDRTLYATFDGARSWQRVVMPGGHTVFDMAASDGRFIAIAPRCPGAANCDHYELATAPIGSPRWSARPIPRSSGVGGEDIGLGAAAGRIWLDEQPPSGALLLVSADQGANYRVEAAPADGPGPCEPMPMTATELWLECPTGMMASFFWSATGGSRFIAFPNSIRYSPTGGGAFAPITGTLAYLDAGVGSRPPGEIYRLRASAKAITATKVGRLSLSSVSSLLFFDPTTALALGWIDSADGRSQRFLVLASGDGGQDWRTIESVSQRPVVASLPRAVAGRLRKIARGLADSLGDDRVHVARVFSTTRRAAAGGDVVNSNQPVYMIVIQGKFVCETCSRPPGAPAPRGSVATLSIDRKTFRVTDFGLTDRVPLLPEGARSYTIRF